MYVSPAETIDTVNVSTNNFDAEQGMAGGAAITVVTKSGTNELRGSAFEFYNSDKLNASPFYFAGQRDAGKPDKVPVSRNIFGGTVGGPIKKNKLFFFGSMEAYKEDRSVQQFFSVPSEALRERRLQPGAERERHAAADLRPGRERHGRPGGPPAVLGQHDPREPHQRESHAS